MNMAGFFIRRPVATTLSMLSILVFGALAYKFLPVSDLPSVDFPTIQVSASYPGASPETMASSVATPLEKEFSTIAGIDSMNSSSTQSSTQITIQFALDRDIDAAAQDIQAAISRSIRRLPSDMPSPPSFRKVNPADQPILFLALTSPNLPMSQLDELGQTMLAQRISTVSGVAQVQVYGSQKYALRVSLSPMAMAGRGIGIDEVATALSNQNVNMPLGSLSGPSKFATIEANGQLTEPWQYQRLIVAYRNSQPVRLQDIGVAADSVENNKTAAWYNTPDSQQRAVILAVQRQPGTNTVEVAQAVRDLLPKFRDGLPASVSLEVMHDSSMIIKESAHDVQFTLVLTLGLVVMVIFLFLRNLAATIIPSLTLPMSIVGTFGVMYLLNYSLDNLSLMALTLSVGFIVDDAIVMLENIVRHMEMGKSRLQASLDGAKEIGFTIVSMTVSLAAVFIPVLFMSGLVGRLFREFAVTIGVAVLVSGVVSLTLTPMMCSRFLRNPKNVRHGLAYRLSESAFEAILKFYDWSLRVVLRHRRLTMLFSLAVLVASIWLFMAIPKGFIPSEDRDQITIGTEGPQDTSFEALAAGQQALAAIVRQNPNVVRFMSSVGSGGAGGSGGNSGRMFLILKPRNERTQSVDEIIAVLRKTLSVVPGMRVYPSNPPTINIGGRMSRSVYQMTLLGSDTDELYGYSTQLEEQIRKMPMFQDVSSDFLMKNPQVRVVIDRDKASSMKVTPRQIEEALYSAYGTRQVSTILAPDNQYQVIMELLPEFQSDPSVLSMLYVRSGDGNLVPLKALTTLQDSIGPLAINHSGQLPSVTISFNLSPGVSLGAAIDAIGTMTASDLPPGMTMNFQGTAQAFKDSLSSMGWLLILTVLVIYIVLGILYESFYHPITILSALPFAGFGALLALVVFDAELSLYAFVGIIMLIGLVKKNGIMMIDFAVAAQRNEGKSAIEAIHQACIVRFRPIMMTTVSALMAGIPIAAGYGAGAEARKPLGLAVVGGLLFSQALTLYVTPVFFIYMEKLRNFIHRTPVETPTVELQNPVSQSESV